VIRAMDSATSHHLLEAARQLSTAPGRNLADVLRMPTALTASNARMRSSGPTRDRSHIVASPQELRISQIPRSITGLGNVVTGPQVTCVVNAMRDGVTQTPTSCEGFNSNRFACPTKGILSTGPRPPVRL